MERMTLYFLLFRWKASTYTVVSWLSCQQGETMSKFFANLRNLVIWCVNNNLISTKKSEPLFYWLNSRSGEFAYWLGE